MFLFNIFVKKNEKRMFIPVDDCCKFRLAKFRLTVQPESPSSATAYTYTEPDTAGQATYTLVPPPSDINFPVSQVRFDARDDSVGDDILTLCEVFVFGGEFNLRTSNTAK